MESDFANIAPRLTDCGLGVPFLIIPLFIAYLFGSIPFGLLLSKVSGHGDIRKIGSGNIGATNVLRTGNKLLAILTLLLDASKGAFVIFFWLYFQKESFCFKDTFLVILGFVSIIGHCYPIWLKFKGGKGVATALGVLLAAVPYVGLIACATWLAAAFAFKISSLAALIAIGLAPIATALIYGPAPAAVCLLIALLIFWRHRTNIQRLLKGEEPKIGSKNKEKQA